jgi:hypothetical protein
MLGQHPFERGACVMAVTDEQQPMIDITELAACKAKDVPIGALYVPIAPNEEHFIAGRVAQEEVLVALDGEEPFAAAPRAEWTYRRQGLAVTAIRFEVDPTSAAPALTSDQSTRGSLVRSAGCYGIIAAGGRMTLTVWLSPKAEDRQITMDDVEFSRWRIVSGPEDHPRVHFSRG